MPTSPVASALAALTLASSLALVGCYASGRKVEQHTLADLQPGTTTCVGVRVRYGPPTSSTIVSGRGEHMTYVYTQSNVDPKSYIPLVGPFIQQSHSEMTTVTFDCDQAGVLLGYTATQGQNTIGTGPISGSPQP